jgi:DNA invertase Pin-like site-specific DNA recombinase
MSGVDYFAAAHSVGEWAECSFRSLGDPLWDTSSAQGRLLSTLLASIAEFERELIRERTDEGRKRRWQAGVTSKLAHDDEMLELAAASGCTMLSIGFESISRTTLKECT